MNSTMTLSVAWRQRVQRRHARGWIWGSIRVGWSSGSISCQAWESTNSTAWPRFLRPRFTVPGERIVRAGDRADACYFIASGAVEVRRPDRNIGLGSGDFFGELALLTGRPRQADVVALTFCRLLTLRRADFEAFLAAHPEAKALITRIAEARIAENEDTSRDSS